MTKRLQITQSEQEDFILILDGGARDLIAKSLKFAGQITREHPQLAEEMGGDAIAQQISGLLMQVHDLMMNAKPSTHVSVEFGKGIRKKEKQNG